MRLHKPRHIARFADVETGGGQRQMVKPLRFEDTGVGDESIGEGPRYRPARRRVRPVFATGIDDSRRPTLLPGSEHQVCGIKMVSQFRIED